MTLNEAAATPDDAPRPLLSICISTFQRAAVIGETLASIVGQLHSDCELLVVDGASPDATEEAVRPFVASNVRYIRQPVNSGVDRDYDDAVSLARGRYCWLMTDDDIVHPGAVASVIEALGSGSQLYIANADVRTADLSESLSDGLLRREGLVRYGSRDIDALFSEIGKYVSFIGSVIISRECWLTRRRKPYYGTLFVHVGVIFQEPPLESTTLIRQPLLSIRYGAAMWSSKAFEVSMVKWPALVWSFVHVSVEARRSVSPRHPALSPIRLLNCRAMGSYSSEALRTLALNDAEPRLWQRLIAYMPAMMVNSFCAIATLVWPAKRRSMKLYELARSKYASPLTLSISRIKGVV